MTMTLLRVLVLGCLFTGCGRHVVVEPERVSELNGKDWKIRKVPRPSFGAPAVPKPPAAAPAPAANPAPATNPGS